MVLIIEESRILVRLNPKGNKVTEDMLGLYIPDRRVVSPCWVAWP
jgi:hypothetical protein